MHKLVLIIFLSNLFGMHAVSAQMDNVRFIQPPVIIPIKHHLSHIQLKDFDGDGKIDLVGKIIEDGDRSSSVSYQAVCIWRNVSSIEKINFYGPEAYGGRRKTGILSLSAQDINEDSRSDLIVFSHRGDIEVYINRSEPGVFRFDKHRIPSLP